MSNYKICVSGWYFNKKLFSFLQNRNSYIVANRNGDCGNIPHSYIEHDQYEWGNYNYYLMNIWDGMSDVLFMHDDIDVVNERVFDFITKICREVTFISTPYVHAIDNDGRIIGSGRMVYIENFILKIIKKRGGFPINKTGNFHMGDILFMKMINHVYHHFITEDFKFGVGDWYTE